MQSVIIHPGLHEIASHNYLNQVLLSVFLTIHPPPVHVGKLILQVTSSSVQCTIRLCKNWL